MATTRLLFGRIYDFGDDFALTIGEEAVAEALSEFDGDQVWVAWGVSTEEITPENVAMKYAEFHDGICKAEFSTFVCESCGYRREHGE